MLLGEAKFKLHCAEFEQEQLQACTNLLWLKHTNKLTARLYASRGHPGTLSWVAGGGHINTAQLPHVISLTLEERNTLLCKESRGVR